MTQRGINYLKQLEHLKTICFWTPGNRADQQVLLLLETLPKLLKAGCLESEVGNGRFGQLKDMSTALSRCSKPLLLRHVNVNYMSTSLSKIVPDVSQLGFLELNNLSPNYLGLKKVSELHILGRTGQAAFNFIIQHYGGQLKVLKLFIEAEGLDLSVVAEYCLALECLEVSPSTIPLPDGLENPWPCLRHFVSLTCDPRSAIPLAHNILSYAMNVQYLKCDVIHLNQVLHDRHDKSREKDCCLFPNLVKAVIYSDKAEKDQFKLFLLQAPKLKHLTLTDWHEGTLTCLTYIPGLQVVYKILSDDIPNKPISKVRLNYPFW